MIARGLGIAGTLAGAAIIVYGATAAETRVAQCASFFPPFDALECAEPLIAVCVGIGLAAACLSALVVDRIRVRSGASSPAPARSSRVSRSLGIVAGAAIGAAVPTSVFSLFYWVGKDSLLTVVVWALWRLVALPGALLDSRGLVTMGVIVAVWASVGGALGWHVSRARETARVQR